MPERLAGPDVGQVHLDPRPWVVRHRVAQAPAGDHQRARVEDGADRVVTALDRADQLTLAVALDRRHLPAAVRDLVAHRVFDLGERVRAVHLRFTFAQNSQIGSVDQKQFIQGAPHVVFSGAVIG